MAFEYTLTPREVARQDAILDMLTSSARAENLVVEKADLLTLDRVRLAIISEIGLDQDAVMAEIKRLPAVAEQVRRKEVQQALNNADSPMQKEIARLNPSQRMALGRKLLQQQESAKAAASPTHNPSMSAEDEAKALRIIQSLTSPQARLNAGRELGLI